MTLLTTLANVKSFANITGSTDDALLTRLIKQASQFIESWLNRTVALTAYTSRINGNGLTRLFIPNFPIISVQSLVIDVTTIQAAATPIASGYQFDEQSIMLNGASFNKGYQNIALNYTAGFLTEDEPHVVPGTPYQIAASALDLVWISDQGVTYSNGTALTKVASSPTVGQYAVSSAGLYTFAAADTGLTLLISYSSVPADIELCCIEILLLQYNYRSRIGVTSKSVGGESITYLKDDMQEFCETTLQQYRRVIPV